MLNLSSPCGRSVKIRRRLGESANQCYQCMEQFSFVLVGLNDRGNFDFSSPELVELNYGSVHASRAPRPCRSNHSCLGIAPAIQQDSRLSWPFDAARPVTEWYKPVLAFRLSASPAIQLHAGQPRSRRAPRYKARQIGQSAQIVDLSLL